MTTSPRTPRRRPTEDDLWAEARTGSARAVNDLVRLHQQIVVDVAKSGNYPRHIEQQHLVAAGQVGLWRAVRDWDPDRGPFVARAKYLIHRAIQEELRSGDRVPRSDRAAITQLRRAEERLTHQLHREPTDAELAGAMHTTEEAVAQVRMAAIQAADTTVEDLYDPSSEVDDPEEAAVYREFSTRVRRALTSIGGRQGIVLRLYYIEKLSMPRIGELLNLKPSMVSRLHTQAVNELRERLR